jgi:signal transduction histidine kinase
VRDNGKGFDSASVSKKKSFGLLGMRERAAVLGGRIDVTSSRKQGTVVRVRIPMKDEEEFSAPVPAATKSHNEKLVEGLG